MTAGWWMAAVLCCGFFLAATKWADGLFRRETGERDRWTLVLLLAASLLVRVVPAAATTGYAADIATFSAWAAHAAEALTSFYSPGYFADYPPGYIYVLWLVGKLRLLLALDFGSPAFLLLLKSPAIAADTVTVWLVYRLALRHGGGNAAVAAAALYAFNPAVILDSAVWGQVDAVLTLFVILGVMTLEEKPGWSGASFAAALLVKPQALIFAPLPILWFCSRLFRESERKRESLAELLLFAGSGLALFSLGVLPFAIGRPAGWIIGKYGGTLASYPYATLNAFNLFALTGGNGAATTERLLFLPYAAWGTLFILLILLFTAAVVLRGRDSSRLWYAALFLSASVFVLSAKMHERYLFPALALALCFSVIARDRRGLWLYAGFTVTQFLNVGAVLALSRREVYLVPRLAPLLLAVSLANVLLWLLLVRIGWRRYVGEVRS
jgi:Gpi18-like mannosyltransferase